MRSVLAESFDGQLGVVAVQPVTCHGFQVVSTIAGESGQRGATLDPVLRLVVNEELDKCGPRHAVRFFGHYGLA
jgi:hypothetical protein